MVVQNGDESHGTIRKKQVTSNKSRIKKKGWSTWRGTLHWKLTWNLKVIQIENEMHLPNLHFWVQKVNFQREVPSIGSTQISGSKGIHPDPETMDTHLGPFYGNTPFRRPQKRVASWHLPFQTFLQGGPLLVTNGYWLLLNGDLNG